MARVALVSGGTRGIGGAFAKSLHDAGYKVAAVYASNDEAAERFHQESGVAVYKWDVSDFEQCQAGILGPHHICLEIHQSRIFSSQRKVSFSNLLGSI